MAQPPDIDRIVKALSRIGVRIIAITTPRGFPSSLDGAQGVEDGETQPDAVPDERSRS